MFHLDFREQRVQGAVVKRRSRRDLEAEGVGCKLFFFSNFKMMCFGAFRGAVFKVYKRVFHKEIFKEFEFFNDFSSVLEL